MNLPTFCGIHNENALEVGRRGNSCTQVAYKSIDTNFNMTILKMKQKLEQALQQYLHSIGVGVIIFITANKYAFC